ncbi:hypothetical protein [Aestuariibaculum sediminum]|uniref:Right handed beta helix domain-containing protein n=1 Tax=Aestuariibaculum sediminum TaxID=2770637 RepID=A0A8J6UC18_9FLAO|nr:hypothetical protein [Aestuariibaculum sediminum]MBD0831854.1 hypothetical protein [Aestuariibaculum sediminum]
MKRHLYFLFTFCLIIFWSSCRKDFEFSPSTGQLEFSKDTVYLDTVFSNIGSSTYSLKVYNRSNTDINIPSVKLKQGNNSNYRLNIDGMAGKVFSNVQIQAKDSIYIFIESTININDFTNNGAFLYTDQIEFDAGSNLQNVELVTLVQDAVFIYPNKDFDTKVIETLSLNIGGEIYETDIEGRELQSNELHFTNEKPYVIYGYAAVPNGYTLTIDSGARIHFHENSGLLVSENASLQVNGTFSTDQELLENEVIFEGDRLEPNFSETPGQWGSIWLFEGSRNNIIEYATIKNASIGILCDGGAEAPESVLKINNSQIYNTVGFGILGRNTSIAAENVVLNKAGQSAFAGTFGGRYNFTHCTIANYWEGPRQFPAVLLNNFFIDNENNTLATDLSEANFNNCIIYGNDNQEILLDEIEDDAINFNFKFTNCLIRFQDNSNFFNGNNYNFEDLSHYENIIINQMPDFFDASNNALIIGDNSSVINKGNANFAIQVPNDILNQNRTSAPDLGAYQHITFPEDDNETLN